MRDWPPSLDPHEFAGSSRAAPLAIHYFDAPGVLLTSFDLQIGHPACFLSASGEQRAGFVFVRTDRSDLKYIFEIRSLSIRVFRGERDLARFDFTAVSGRQRRGQRPQSNHRFVIT